MAKLIVVLILAAGLALFAAENTGLVAVRFLAWQSPPISLALLIIFTAVIGALGALIATLPIHHRRRRELARSKRELEELRGREL